METSTSSGGFIPAEKLFRSATEAPGTDTEVDKLDTFARVILKIKERLNVGVRWIH